MGPASFENVPVGPSAPSSASRTGSRAPSATLRVPVWSLKSDFRRLVGTTPGQYARGA
jgi:hypothetical protein